jgi:hypothetical protein
MTTLQNAVAAAHGQIFWQKSVRMLQKCISQESEDKTDSCTSKAQEIWSEKIKFNLVQNIEDQDGSFVQKAAGKQYVEARLQDSALVGRLKLRAIAIFNSCYKEGADLHICVAEARSACVLSACYETLELRISLDSTCCWSM